MSLSIYLYISCNNKVANYDKDVSRFNMPKIVFFCDDSRINEIDGTYTKPNDFVNCDYVCYMRDKRLYFAVSSDNKPSDIKYKIISIDGNNVYQTGDIDYKNIKNIGNKDVDNNEVINYLDVNDLIYYDKLNNFELKLILDMKINRRHVYYVVRLSKMRNLYFINEFNFAKLFSNSTTENNEFKKYESYIICKDKNYNNNSIADVNINSPHKYINWCGINCDRITKTKWYIMNIGKESSKFKAMYRINLIINNKKEQYLVSEYIEVMYNKNKNIQSILDYKRNANREILINDDIVNSKYINFGIGKYNSVNNGEYIVSNNGKYVGVVIGGALWEYNVMNGIMTRLYPFVHESKFTDQITSSRKIKIIDISANGELTFVVIGKCLYGKDVGKNGATIYYYGGSDDNKVYQDAFVESCLSKTNIEKIMNFVFNIHDKGITYYVFGDEVLCDKNGDITIIDKTNNSSSFVHSNNLKYIAYSIEDGIKILNLDKKNTYTIHMHRNELFHIIGFTGNNLVYGIFHEEDFGTDINGKEIRPYSQIIICDCKGNEIEHYGYNGELYLSNGIKHGNLSIIAINKNNNDMYTYGKINYIINQDNRINTTIVPCQYIDDKYGICKSLKFNKNLKVITYSTVNFVNLSK